MSDLLKINVNEHTEGHQTERSAEKPEAVIAAPVRCPFCGSSEWPVQYAGQGDHL